MATLNMKNDKQSFKIIEIPLNKFTEEMIPHHQQVFEKHKSSCQKLIAENNVKQLCREIKDKDRILKQVKDLMYELDTLRAQVEDSDLDKFDSQTLSLRKIILTLINGYKGLKATAQQLVQTQEEEERDEAQLQHPFENVAQLQIHANPDDIKLKGDMTRLGKVEAIEEDVKDLNEIFTQLNEMVGDQQQNVDHVEESVESTNTNVQAGLRNLIKAHKLKATTYSVTGAFLGGMIGGPIGLVAGLKVGGLAALGCAVAGFSGGQYLKKISNCEANDSETKTAQSQQQPNQEVSSESGDKKDI